MKPYDQTPAVTVDDDTVTTRLRRQWLDLTTTLGAEVVIAEKWFHTIRRAYSLPQRHYHNLEHLDAVLTEIDQAGARTVKDAPALLLAAWFHDAVYDVHRNDNEVRSAAAAVNVLSGLVLSKERLRTVRDLILCTRYHECDSADGRILIDADLAILGAPADRYRDYAAAIKREFATIPEDRYRVGRMKMLQTLLKRGKIFQTMRGQRLYEEAARQNVAREIAELAMSRPKIVTTVPATVKPATTKPLPGTERMSKDDRSNSRNPRPRPQGQGAPGAR